MIGRASGARTVHADRRLVGANGVGRLGRARRLPDRGRVVARPNPQPRSSSTPGSGCLVVLMARHVPETSDPRSHGEPDVRARCWRRRLGGPTYALIRSAGPRGSRSPIVLTAVAVGAAPRGSCSPSGAARNRCFAARPLRIAPVRMLANAVTSVVYAAMRRRLLPAFVSFLQISRHYYAGAAGACVLPQTVPEAVLSRSLGRPGAAHRPRIPLPSALSWVGM